jgi:ferric-dicitrate binding protein FerR (iron transport regulator)
MDQHRLRILFDKYIDRQCSVSELKELVTLLQQAGTEDILTEPMEILWEELKQDPKQYPINWELIYKNVMHADNRPAKIHSIQKFWWIAASVVVVLGMGALLMFNQKPKNQLAIDKEPTIKTDVAPPRSSHAIITLVNGETIVLDSVKNGSLAKQGNVNLVKLADGKLVYSQAASGVNSQEITYNTITVPRGSQVVSLTLADGTKVWMNAASSMRYPTSFIGNERKVEITGEAYFEVTHNAKMPFRVKKGDAEIEVLGTNFNVNAYDDENNIRITLVSGSVKIKKENQSMIIKPGDQAEINELGKIGLNKNVDVEEVIAWKNGLFVFNNTDLELIMRQIGRWYDVDVKYSGAPAKGKHYSGYVPRLVNVSRVLHMLESAGGVEFTIDGKKIMVKVK